MESFLSSLGNTAMNTKPDYYVHRWDDIELPLFFKHIRKNYDAEGLCWDPHSDEPQIWVEDRLGKRRKLNVLIEEMCHAFFYDEPEYKVRKFSAELGKIIYNRFLKQGAIEQ